jgi:hypothetical protein
MTPDELIEALKDDLRDTRIETVKMLLLMYLQGEKARKLASDIVDGLFPDQDFINDKKALAQHND